MSYPRKTLVLTLVALFTFVFLISVSNPSEAKLAPIVEIPSQATTIAWDSEGTKLAVGHVDATVSVWSHEDQTYTQTIELSTTFQRDIMSLAWSPNGALLAGGDFEGHVLIWDTITGDIINDIKGDRSWVASLAWSPNSSFIAVSKNSNVAVWNITNSEEVLHLDTGLASLFWVSENNLLVNYDDIGKPVELWDVVKGEKITQYDNVGTEITLDSNKTKLAGKQGIWDIFTSQLVVSACRECYGENIISLVWSSDDDKVANGSGDSIEVHDFTVRAWNASDGQLISIMEGHASSVVALAWHPDNITLTSVSFDNTVRIWDVSSGQLLKSFYIDNLGDLKRIALRSDGEAMAVIGIDGVTRIWDLTT